MGRSSFRRPCGTDFLILLFEGNRHPFLAILGGGPPLDVVPCTLLFLMSLDLMTASAEHLESSGVSLYLSAQLSERPTLCSIYVSITMDVIDMQRSPIF